jgi:FKBP-type peptidyl-prolyl cis-trans isomerase FkpA
MRRLVLVSALVLAAGCTAKVPEVKVDTEEQKTLYSLGYAVAENLKPFNLTKEELEIVKLGFADSVLSNKAVVDAKEYFPKIRDLQMARAEAQSKIEKEKGAAYLAKAATEAGANKLPSGLVITTITEGTGASPTATDTVKVHYHGTLPSGKVFDSSVERKEPATFPLNGVIPCWTEGVQKIKVGGKAKLVCPPELAYGENAPPQIGPGATLIFEVELLDIVKQ